MSCLAARFSLLGPRCGGRTLATLHNSSNKPLLFAAQRKPVLIPGTTIHTCAPLSAYVKTEIQKWGWNYLNQQKDLQRPLSPHLTIYKPMLTWMVSGLFRMTGVAMGTVVACAAVTLTVAPFDFPQVVEFIRGLGLPVVMTTAFKFIIAWPIIFHYLNGIRFLAFDMAKGTDIVSVYKTGWLVVFLSLFLAAVAVFWPKSAESTEAKQA